MSAPAGAAAQAPPPVFPDTISRDDAGHVIVLAIRLTSPLRLDGRLDEAIYREMRPASGFIQEEPKNGAPATEKTEIWILYDDENVYVGARMWESQPDRMVVNEMRKDSPSVFQNENLTIAFDTFYDRRNGVAFVINPIGGRQDGQITNERWNRDWNTIFDFGVGTFDGGWTAELAIPFKSLRYRPGTAQLWGINARRVNKWKNEFSNLVPTPTTGGFGSGVYKTSLAATLVGLEVPPGSKNLEIKPYAISNVTTDRNAVPTIAHDVGAAVGVDVKYGVTQNVIADFTYNTDFAQVEADEQQVNLTRFSLFFPEKREFFLENPGLFAFGGVNTVNSGQTTSDAPMLFYSRRIGLNQGRVVPLDAGGRVTGRVGRYTVGLMNIQTGEESWSRSRPTNFSVMRLKRDLLRKSSIGLIATGRSVTANGIGSNTVFGVDGAFSFFDNVDFNTYWARTQTTGVSGDDTSYRTSFVYGGDRYGVELERLAVGDHFNPEVGFLRRHDMRRSSAQARFSPRPKSDLVRKYSWTGSIDYTENGAGRLETRETEGVFGIEFQSSDRFYASYLSSYELLPRPFRIAPGIVVPVGGYYADRLRVTFSLGQQRLVSGNMFAEYGTFYTGHRATWGFTSGRVKLTSQFSVEPTYSINKVDLLEGSFTTHLAGSRVTYSMTPLMFAAALLQYNSTNHVVSANARLRWEYAPGSELFVVYNEERDTVVPRFPDLANRSFIIKVNRLLRF